MKQHYVLGFAFDPDQRSVALIRKNKPEWQAGKLNGVGGKIEPNETAREAMKREFEEEAGVRTSAWTFFAEMIFPDAWVHCFFTVLLLSEAEKITSKTDEQVDWFWIDDILSRGATKVIPNLKWLIPMALSFPSRPIPCTINEYY